MLFKGGREGEEGGGEEKEEGGGPQGGGVGP